MTRFVILHHTLSNGEHWDLMLEHQGVLLTWQLLSEPHGPASLPIAARRIGNHRLAYLTYEGAISGDRGIVHRVAEGGSKIIAIHDSHCVFEARGQVFHGRFRLRRDDLDWIFEVMDDSI